MVETQKYLFDHSAELPEGLYIELMNKLKIDFDNGPTKIVYAYPIKRYIKMNKADILHMILDKITDYPDKDEIIKHIMVANVAALTRYCNVKHWGTTKKNPKFIE